MRPDINEFISALRRSNRKYIPLAELGVHPLIKAKILGFPLAGDHGEVRFAQAMGYDYVKLQPIADFNPAAKGGNDNVMENPDRTVVRKWAKEGEGLITSEEEYESYQFPMTSDFDYSRFEKITGFLPEGMGVVGQYGDIFTMTWEMMGFETFSFALYENPELVLQLNTTLGELVLSMFEYMAQSPAVDVLWYSDDIAYTNGLLVSPDVLDEYFFPWLKKIGALAKRYNKPLIYHTDGILYDVMERILDCGVDALHPIEPKAMDIGEVKQRYGDRLCLVGNIDVDLLSRGTEEEVRAMVRQTTEKAGGNGGYCAGSGNSVPEYVRVENYLAMVDEAKKFRY